MKKQIVNLERWYQGVLGQRLLEQITNKLDTVLNSSFGYYLLKAGTVSIPDSKLTRCRIRYQFDFSSNSDFYDVQSKLYALPVASESVDLFILFHGLSQSSQPHEILREIDRVLIPEGKLIVIDFNPFSLWGVRHFFQSWLEKPPWSGRYYTISRSNDWMRLLGFVAVKTFRIGYLPPVDKEKILSHMNWFEKALKKWLPFAGTINMIVYEKKITPMTKIRQSWVKSSVLAGKLVGRQTSGSTRLGKSMRYGK